MTGSELVEYRLPNGLEILCVSQAEAAALYHEIFTQRCWLDGGVRLRDGDTVVDVGANIGLSTLFFHRECHDVRLVSFEPAPVPFAALRGNVGRHGVSAVCRPVAVGASARHATMSYYPQVTAMSGLYARPSDDATVTRTYLRNCGFSADDIADIVPAEYTRDTFDVEVRTLSDEVRDIGLHGIALLKIDVEKSEIDVLAGIDQDVWAMVEQVAVEVHDLDGALRTAREMLVAQGFAVRAWQSPLMRGTVIHAMTGIRNRT